MTIKLGAKHKGGGEAARLQPALIIHIPSVGSKTPRPRLLTRKSPREKAAAICNIKESCSENPRGASCWRCERKKLLRQQIVSRDWDAWSKRIGSHFRLIFGPYSKFCIRPSSKILPRLFFLLRGRERGGGGATKRSCRKHAKLFAWPINKQNKKMFSLRVFKNVVANMYQDCRYFCCRSQTICATPAPLLWLKMVSV